MYVAPRPKEEDDPLFAVRMTCVVIAGIVFAIVCRSPMAPIYPSLMYGMIAGSRGAFSIGRAIAAPLSFTIGMWLMVGLVTMLGSLPLLLFGVIAAIMFGAFYLAMKSSNPLPMLLLMPLVMASVLGIGSYQSMTMLRDEMSKAALFAALVAPVLYFLLPTKATWVDKPVYAAVHSDGVAARAAIRTLVLLLFCCWIYITLGSANMMLAIGATFVLMFPTRETLQAEAWERSFSTLLGGGVGIVIILIVNVVAHPLIFLLLVALGALYFSQKMVDGRHPAMVYQFGASAMISVATAAVGGQEPTYALLTRVILTFGGAVAAAYLTILLESLFVGKKTVEATT